MIGDEPGPQHRTRRFQLGAAIAALVLTGIGGAWAFIPLATRAATSPWAFGGFALPVIGLGFWGVRRLITIAGLPAHDRSEAAAAEGARQGRRLGIWFGLIFAIEGAAIAGAAVTLGWLGRPLLIPVAVVVIVGLHFLPLARLFRMPIYRTTGLALIVLAALSFTIPGEPTRVFLLAIATAFTLWGAAAWVLARHT